MRKLSKFLLIGFILLAGFVFYILENELGGWRAFIITSGSMTPAIGTGSVILDQYILPKKLLKGDIITFIPPAGKRELVTHRISRISERNNLRTFRTKGDKNLSEDAWILAEGGVVGKVAIVIPILGYFIAMAQSKIGIILLILLPSTYIIISEIFNIGKNIKQYREKQRTGPKMIMGVFIFFLISSQFFSAKQTYALLSDTSGLANNFFSIPDPAPTSLPTPTGTPPPIQTVTPIPSPVDSPTAQPTSVPTQAQSPTPLPTINTPTPTNVPSEYPSCIAPRGKIISSYAVGMHEIIGVGLLKGSDIVYQLTKNSKEKVLQCYCSESGRGIQTNWLKTREIEKYKLLGWPYSIVSGTGWNLDAGSYVAQNIDYICNK